MEPRFKNHDDFFKQCGESGIQVYSYGQQVESISINEMYQHFKNKLIDDLKKKGAD